MLVTTLSALYMLQKHYHILKNCFLVPMVCFLYPVPLCQILHQSLHLMKNLYTVALTCHQQENHWTKFDCSFE